MKSKYKSSLAFLALTAAIGFNALAKDSNILGTHFAAPTVEETSNIVDPVLGEIVYSDSDQTFYGRANSTTPTWVALNVTGNARASWSGYHDGNCSFSRTNSSYGNPAADSTCTFASRQNNGMGTVTSYLSGSDPLPGIVFSPPRTGYYQICAKSHGELATTAAYGTIKLTDGTNVIFVDEMRGQATNAGFSLGTCGLWYASSTSSVTLRIETKSTSGQILITSNATADPSIEWSIFEMN